MLESVKLGLQLLTTPLQISNLFLKRDVLLPESFVLFKQDRVLFCKVSSSLVFFKKFLFEVLLVLVSAFFVPGLGLTRRTVAGGGQVYAEAYPPFTVSKSVNIE